MPAPLERRWPRLEFENGVYKIDKKPKEKMPVADWMKKQGRFKHLFKSGFGWGVFLVDL